MPNPKNKYYAHLKIALPCAVVFFLLTNGQLFWIMSKVLPNAIFAGEIEKDSDAESIYESRKLLIRQMQGQIAKQVGGANLSNGGLFDAMIMQVHEGRDSVSEYDSWTDLEENFALAYEPIPLSIKMATWRKMTKR